MLGLGPLAVEVAAAEMVREWHIERLWWYWHMDLHEPVADYSGCLPLGYLLDPEGDNDEESDKGFDGGREDLEEED